MANSDRPRGFTNPQSDTGSPPVVEERLNAGEIFQGDLVKLDGSGRVVAVNGVSDIPYGVAAHYRSSTAGQKIQVYADLKNTTWEVQVDDASIADSTQDGNLFDIVLTHAGSSTTLQSGMELDGNASAQDTLRLLGLVNRPDNAYGANAKVRVRFNKWAQEGSRSS